MIIKNIKITSAVPEFTAKNAVNTYGTLRMSIKEMDLFNKHKGFISLHNSNSESSYTVGKITNVVPACNNSKTHRVIIHFTPVDRVISAPRARREQLRYDTYEMFTSIVPVLMLTEAVEQMREDYKDNPEWFVSKEQKQDYYYGERNILRAIEVLLNNGEEDGS